MTKSSTQKPLIDLSEDEQMDIINKSGVAHKLKESRQEEQDVAFFGFLLSMSAMFLFGSSNHISDNTIGMFEYLVYIQFENPSVAPPIDYFGLASAYLPHAICITFLSYASFYVKNSRAFQYIFCLSAIGCGCMVMYQILQVGTYGAHKMVPGLITLGIILVIQMDLDLTVVTLLGCSIYYLVTFSSLFNSKGINLKDEL